MNKQLRFRVLFYLLGLLVLALGLTLNTKVGLGVSPIISVSFSVSTIWGFNFGNTTLVLYALFVIAQIALHLFQYRRSCAGPEGGRACAVQTHRPAHGAAA